MGKGSWRGAITVYLSIILTSVILLSGVLMDIVRIKAAEIQVRRAVNTAAYSALAGYNTKLKVDYGLFASHENDGSKLGDIIESYIRKNLLIEPKEGKGSDIAYDFLKSIVINDEYKAAKFIDLYDYKIESIDVVPLFNFTENEITRQQMAEYMKYRAPAQFAENFMEKVNYVSSTAELTDAYKQKTVIEKKMAKVEKALIKLQEEIDQLNRFNKNDFDNRQGSGSLVETYIEYGVQQSVYAVYGSVDIAAAENEEEQKKVEELQEYAAELYEEASKNTDNAMRELEEHISGCLDAAHNASKEVNVIKEMVNSLREDIDTLKRSLKELESDSNQDKPQIAASLKQDIAKWEQLIDSESSSDILETLERDTYLLDSIKNDLSDIPSLIDSYSEGLRSQADDNMRNAISDGESLDITGTSGFKTAVGRVLSSPDMREIAASVKQFEAIKEILSKSSKKQGKDPRKTIASSAKEIKAEISSISNPPKRIDEPTLLPSYYINGTYPNKIFSDGIVQLETKEDTESSRDDDYEVDFENDSSFSENTFSFITRFATKLRQYAENLRDDIYINEYILATFKDAVEIKDSGTDGKLRDTMFDNNEVEYILAGAPGENQNYLIIKGEILLIRFGMNTLHVYSDPQKRLKALEIATAAAGITGFGIPVAHNLIMCSWGMAESFQDMKDLYQGKRVPFIKTVQTWRTDLIPGGYKVDDKEQNQGSIMDFDYHDYLRLLLLVQNKEIKMNRIEDLIQLNMQKNDPGFKLSSCTTYVKVNVQVSIRYWFITKIFVPSKFKTPDGRHRIAIEAWKGY